LWKYYIIKKGFIEKNKKKCIIDVSKKEVVKMEKESLKFKIFNNRLIRKYRELIVTGIDLVFVFVSFMASYTFKYGLKIFNFNRQHIILTFVLALVVYTISFKLFKIGKSLWKYISTKELITIACSIAFSTVVLVILDPILKLRGEVLLYGLAGILTFFLMIYLRFVYRFIRYHDSRKSKNERALIIGAGDGGYLLLKELSQNKDMRVDVVGFVDDYRTGNIIAGKSILGTTNDLKNLVKKYSIDMLYIAIPSAKKEELTRIYDQCIETNTPTKIMKKGVNFLMDSIEENYQPKEISIEDLLGRGEVKLNQQEISSYLFNKVVAVTGAGGSIGSELCRQIIRFNPKRLVMIDINENGLYMLEQEFNRYRNQHKMNEKIEIISYITSIRDRKALDKVFEKEHPVVVYHAAAHKHVPLMETTPLEAIKNNVFGTNNVIHTCIDHQVERFIMISTDKAVNPTNVMGATKRMTELLLQANGNNGITKMAAVRFGNVLGSNGSVIPIFKHQIAEGGPVTLTHKDIKRYFMTIPEAAQLVLQAGYYADQGDIFVLDMGEQVKILHLAEKMIRLSGFEPYKDIDIIEIGLRPGEKMYEELSLGNEKRHKTANDLIMVNEHMDISLEDINNKLDILQTLIHSNKTNDEIKDTLLELIK